jgi:hypothetical protein
VDHELGVDIASGSVTDLADCAADLPELVNCHLERWLVGLVDGPNWVVHARSGAHLDVAAQHMAHRVDLGEHDQPVNGRTEGRPVLDVKAARVDGVAVSRSPVYAS